MKTSLGGIYFTKHLKEPHREYVMVDLLVWIHQGNNKKHLKTFWKRTISTKQNSILEIWHFAAPTRMLSSLQLSLYPYPLLVGWKGFQVCNKLIIPFTSQPELIHSLAILIQNGWIWPNSNYTIEWAYSKFTNTFGMSLTKNLYLSYAYFMSLSVCGVTCWFYLKCIWKSKKEKVIGFKI